MEADASTVSSAAIPLDFQLQEHTKRRVRQTSAAFQIDARSLIKAVPRDSEILQVVPVQVLPVFEGWKVEVQPEHDRLAFSLYGLEESMRPQAVEWLVQVRLGSSSDIWGGLATQTEDLSGNGLLVSMKISKLMYQSVRRSPEGEVFLLDFSVISTYDTAPPSAQAVASVSSGNAAAFGNPRLCDVKFTFSSSSKGQKERYLYARECVLRQRCPYFEDMFRFSEHTSHDDGAASPPVGATASLETVTEEGPDSDSDSEDETQDTVDKTERSLNISFVEVPIRSTKYRTWRALLFYIETGCIYFSPLRSSFRDGAASPESNAWRDYAREHRTVIAEIEIDHPFECSPKSMYTLADMIGLSALKGLAYNQIIASLTLANILRELSSPFAFKYSEIQAAEYSHLQQHWANVRTNEATTNIFLEQLDLSPEWTKLLVNLLKM